MLASLPNPLPKMSNSHKLTERRAPETGLAQPHTSERRSRRFEPAAGRSESAEPARVTVLGVPVVSSRAEPILAEIERALDAHRATTVYFANAHSLNLATEQPHFRAALQAASLVLNDGAGLSIAGRMQGAPFPENLNGSDLTPRVLAIAARRNAPAFFLGGRPGVAAQAAERLRSDIPGLSVVGCRDGYFEEGDSSALAAEIRRSGAALLIVALGNPRQELWLDRHLPETGASVGMAVGAYLDFASGRINRAPAWMNRFGLEWLFRIALEPGRLWRRYVIGNPRFLVRVLRETAARSARRPSV